MFVLIILIHLSSTQSTVQTIDNFESAATCLAVRDVVVKEIKNKDITIGCFKK